MNAPLQILAAVEGSNTALVSFGIYLLAVLFLAWLSNRVKTGKSFVSEYFLGSRSFGVWAFALTFAATSASGGSFMGFPSLIYTHGWVLALWIASYMVMPIVAMGLFGKRLNQVARRAKAVTLPEVLRERFSSTPVGMVATLMVVFFMFFYLIAQFKAGAKILSTLLQDVALFRDAAASVGNLSSGIPWVGSAEPEYLLCLCVFAVSVIFYVVYGGFRAVVWTDVMQGIVMVIGVILMLVFALSQVGGLGNATRKLAEMTPPEPCQIVIQSPEEVSNTEIPKGAWVRIGGEDGLVRIKNSATIPAGQTTSGEIEAIRITTPSEIDAVMATLEPSPLSALINSTQPYQFGAGKQGVYVSAPGPSPNKDVGFLGIGLAFSFFVFWAFSAAGQPSNMVRLMAFKDTKTLRRSIITVSVYYSVIYFFLVVIFCIARVMMPGMEVDSDRIMPDFAAHLTTNAGVPWLAGLLVAAPFAAVMSSVDSFLLLVSSSLIRDVYQRSIRPEATDAQIRKLTYWITTLVGIGAAFAAINPPEYLQDLIIFSSGGLAAAFFIPVILALYWPRMTARGAVAGMFCGCLTHLVLFAIGAAIHGEFGTAYQLFGLHPFIWDQVGAVIGVIVFSWTGPAPDQSLVQRFFGRREA